MKPIRTPTEAELAEEFDEAFTESRQQARVAGMTPSDIRQAILEVEEKRIAEARTRIEVLVAGGRRPGFAKSPESVTLVEFGNPCGAYAP